MNNDTAADWLLTIEPTVDQHLGAATTFADSLQEVDPFGFRTSDRPIEPDTTNQRGRPRRDDTPLIDLLIPAVPTPLSVDIPAELIARLQVKRARMKVPRADRADARRRR